MTVTRCLSGTTEMGIVAEAAANAVTAKNLAERQLEQSYRSTRIPRAAKQGKLETWVEIAGRTGSMRQESPRARSKYASDREEAELCVRSRLGA